MPWPATRFRGERSRLLGSTGRSLGPRLLCSGQQVVSFGTGNVGSERGTACSGLQAVRWDRKTVCWVASRPPGPRNGFLGCGRPSLDAKSRLPRFARRRRNPIHRCQRLGAAPSETRAASSESGAVSSERRSVTSGTRSGADHGEPVSGHSGLTSGEEHRDRGDQRHRRGTQPVEQRAVEVVASPMSGMPTA